MLEIGTTAKFIVVLPFSRWFCEGAFERKIWTSRIISAIKKQTTMHLFTIILVIIEMTLEQSIHPRLFRNASEKELNNLYFDSI